MLNKQKLASEKNLTQYYTDSELFWENLIQNPHTNRDTTLILFRSLQQWPFQEPKLEVPTIHKAYFRGLNFREYPSKIWPEIWY